MNLHTEASNNLCAHAQSIEDGEELRAEAWDRLGVSKCGEGIVLRDSQTAQINANNWILPAISVSLDLRAAQLRSAFLRGKERAA